MTCCIGFIDKNGDILMGADSAATSSESKRIYRQPKKVFIKNNFIFGFSGSFRPGQLLQYRFDPPQQDKKIDTDTYINTTFIDALRDCFECNDYCINDLDKKLLDNDFLIGYDSKLFIINNDYHISEVEANYTAIGSGADVALGSMYSTKYTTDSMERIKLALKAANYFISSVSPPYYVLKLSNKKE